MADIAVHKAPKELAVVPFYATAALFFLLLCILLFLHASELTGQHFNPHILAIVHCASLGWGTMIIFGAAYQLLPVICERELFSHRLAFLSYILLTLGSCGLIHAFWTFSINGLLIASGSCVALSSYLYAINLYQTANSCNHSQVQQHFLLLSAFWLCLTTTLGLLLAINLQHNFIPRSHLDLLKLHAHAGLAGWLLQLVCGVGAKLFPMFLLGKSQKTKLLYASLILQNLGLILFLVDGYFNPHSLRIGLYAGIVALGFACWLYYIIEVYRHRARKKIDSLMKQAGSSLVCLILAFLSMPLLFLSAQTKWVSLYASLIFLGWLTGIILGKTFKTLPFIIWNKRYKDLNGSTKIPMPKQLYKEALLPYQYYLYLGAMLSLLMGLIIEQKLILQFSGLLWIALALVYGYNVYHTIFHHPKIQA